jgi:hypothetical protein
MIAVTAIMIILNLISQGNITGIGLGDFIMIIIGFSYISNSLIKCIWKEK